jgi:hypothetical protein
MCRSVQGFASLQVRALRISPIFHERRGSFRGSLQPELQFFGTARGVLRSSAGVVNHTLIVQVILLTGVVRFNLANRLGLDAEEHRYLTSSS